MRYVAFVVVLALSIFTIGCSTGGSSPEDAFKDDPGESSGPFFSTGDQMDDGDEGSASSDGTLMKSQTVILRIETSRIGPRSITKDFDKDITARCSSKCVWKKIVGIEGETFPEWLGQESQGSKLKLTAKKEVMRVGAYGIKVEVCEEAEETQCVFKEYTFKVTDELVMEVYRLNNQQEEIEDEVSVPNGDKLLFKIVGNTLEHPNFEWKTSDEEEVKLTVAADGMSATLEPKNSEEGAEINDLTVKAEETTLGNKAKAESLNVNFNGSPCESAITITAQKSTDISDGSNAIIFKLSGGKAPYKKVLGECYGEELAAGASAWTTVTDGIYPAACEWDAAVGGAANDEIRVKLKSFSAPADVSDYEVMAYLQVKDGCNSYATKEASLFKKSDSNTGASRGGYQSFKVEIFSDANFKGQVWKFDTIDELEYLSDITKYPENLEIKIADGNGQTLKLTGSIKERALNYGGDDGFTAKPWKRYTVWVPETYKSNSFRVTIGDYSTYESCYVNVNLHEDKTCDQNDGQGHNCISNGFRWRDTPSTFPLEKRDDSAGITNTRSDADGKFVIEMPVFDASRGWEYELVYVMHRIDVICIPK